MCKAFLFVLFFLVSDISRLNAGNPAGILRCNNNYINNYYQNLALNPAFAGSTINKNSFRFNTFITSKFPEIDLLANEFQVSGEAQFSFLSSGLGFYYNRKQYAGGMNERVGGAQNFAINLGNIILRMGGSAEYIARINYRDRFVLPDEIVDPITGEVNNGYYGSPASPSSGDRGKMKPKSRAFNANIGMLLQSNDFYLGTGIRNVTEPELTLLYDVNRSKNIPRIFFLNMGYSINIGNENRQRKIIPTINFDQMQSIKMLSPGLSISGNTNYLVGFQYSNFNQLVLNTSFQLNKNFRFSGAYGMPVNELFRLTKISFLNVGFDIKI